MVQSVAHLRMKTVRHARDCAHSGNDRVAKTRKRPKSAKIRPDAAAFRGRAQRRARVSTGVPDHEGARDGRARDRAARGDRQHRRRPHRRADRDRRRRRARLPVLGRDQARRRLLAGVPLRAGQDGRRDRAELQRDQDRPRQRAADAGSRRSSRWRPALATAPPSASPSRPTRSSSPSRSGARSSRSTSTGSSTSSRTSPSCWPRPTRPWPRWTSTAAASTRSRRV